MPIYKNTTIFSEISSFFKKNDSQSAIFTIMDMIKSINMPEKVLFGTQTRFNSKYSLSQVFQLLIMFPCFMVRNPFNYGQSAMSHFFGCEKDVFYRFANNESFDWRKILYHITLQVWNKVRLRGDHKGNPVCLMVDDTDFPKTGRRIENIGRVFSHVSHKTILGFKSLFLGITDGKSQFILDFAILGEEGKKKNFSMSARELAARFSKERDEGAPVQTRSGEYKKGKIRMMIEMIRRAIKKGVRFDYVLADSWFACGEVIRFIRSRHIRCHYLGMIKIGEKGKTKYRFEGKDLTAPALVKLLEGRGKRKYSRKLRCYYMTANVVFAGTDARLFFVRRNRRGPWNGLVTTNRNLDFFEAYRIYAMRWSLEVVFKDSKGLLGL
ncbi:MAG: transposase, partial [Tannerellaceae bacterium]|nr:transposase [Tannerellaceae bacterium]